MTTLAYAPSPLQHAPSSGPLADLETGDIVTVLRNLDHPAWHGRTPSVGEIVGQARVIQTRRVPAVAGAPGFRGSARPAAKLVRLSNNLWYDVADGRQRYFGATRIVPA